jgi:hypothetical protein
MVDNPVIIASATIESLIATVRSATVDGSVNRERQPSRGGVK